MGCGVTGKFFNILKTLYTNDNCCVKVGNNITDTFQANQGVKQGCILSPLLFNIFLSDLVDRFNAEKCKPLDIGKSEKLGCLLWADDLVLLSNSEDGLKHMFSELSSYVEENRMEINTEKTKCVIFNKTGKYLRRSYILKNEIVYTTNSYKYLGFVITPSGEITSGLKDLKDRALRAYYILKNKMGQYFRLCPSTTISLFNALIKPILLYNSDFWGCLKIPQNNPIENVHTRFCKELLGVQKQTTNIGVLLELGTIPIMLYGKKNCIKNWSRIHTTGKANKIVLKSHKISIENNLTWPVAVKDCLNRIGIGSDTNTPGIHIAAFTRMKDIFHQESFSEIKKVESKLRTYAKLKTIIGMEKYIDLIQNTEERAAISKIRLSNHDLMIEKGRHLKIRKEQRFCPFCTNTVETEHHFILNCETFTPLRNQLIDEVGRILPVFYQLQEDEKFVALLNNENIIQLVGNYLHRALQCRRFLLKKHKNKE